jgi:CzcA family heavy metal efflux pump
MKTRQVQTRLQRLAPAIWLAVALVTVGGVLAALNLPVALFPHIDYPRVVVSIDAGDRDADQMAAEITRPVEVALREVPGVTRINSTTSRGSADVDLNFGWGEDMVAAKLATESALAQLTTDLPSGTRFTVRRSDPTVFPMLGIALTSKSLDQAALRQIAELKIRPALTGVPEVAGVEVLGGSPREIEVDIDPAKMQALGIGITDVTGALAKANQIDGLGRIEDRHRLYLVLAESRLASTADLAAVPVKAGAGGAGVVTLGQIAAIHPSTEPNFTRVTSNGEDAVLVNIHQSPTGDTVQIVKAVQARLKALALPPSVKVTDFYDQSELVVGAADSVRDAILLGAVLAGIVLFIFLRSPRLMVITGLMLPAVLAATCLFLFALKMSFNMMTLGGMAAAVGLVVDDAVVMLEHIMRRMQEGHNRDREERRTATERLAAAAEMGRPLLGSTAATIIVFLPLAFISGVTGGFFKALAVTMVAALVVSLLYARFVIPLLAATWLREKDAHAAEKANGFMGVLVAIYAGISRPALHAPKIFALIVAAVFVVAGGLAWTHVPSGFMPKMDEGGFILDYKAQSGAALSDTDRLLRQVEKIIVDTPEVASYSRRTGAQLGGGLTEADEGDYFIRLKSGARRNIEEVMAEIRQKVQTEVPGLDIETAQLMEDLIGDLTAVPEPIEVKLFGYDPKVLSASAVKVGDAIGKIPGVVEVVDGQRVAGDTINIHVDPGLAAQQGLDPQAVSDQLSALIGGAQATQMRLGEQLVAVRVRGPADLRQRADMLSNLPLTAPDGHTLRVGQVATVTIVAGQKQLTREDLAPYVAVTARLEGRDLGSGMKAVQATVAGLHLPASIRVDYGGLYAEQQKSFTDLAVVFTAALLLSALLLTVLFERFTWTVAALLTVLLSVGAVLCGLWITGIELDISALMGLTMVVGMVTELAIFYLAEIETEGPPTRQSLLEAGRKRLRPILMSALIAILTLSPLALGLSRGSGLQQPLATAIIFGLTAAVPLLLLFLPAVIMSLSKVAKDNGTHSV